MLPPKVAYFNQDCLRPLSLSRSETAVSRTSDWRTESCETVSSDLLDAFRSILQIHKWQKSSSFHLYGYWHRKEKNEQILFVRRRKRQKSSSFHLNGYEYRNDKIEQIPLVQIKRIRKLVSRSHVWNPCEIEQISQIRIQKQQNEIISISTDTDTETTKT